MFSRARLVTPVICPKFASPKVFPGLSKCGVLEKLNDSIRNRTCQRSVMRNSRNSPKSQLARPGPRRKLYPVFPKRPCAGGAKAVGSNNGLPRPIDHGFATDGFT